MHDGAPERQPEDIDEIAASDQPSPAAMPFPGQMLYTSEQAAVLLQMSAGWLRRQAAQNLVGHVLIARKVRFTRADLEDIITRHHRAAKRRA